MEPKSHGFSPVTTAGKIPSSFGRLSEHALSSSLGRLLLVLGLLVATFLVQAQTVSCPYTGAQTSNTVVDTDVIPAGPFLVTDDYDVFPTALASQVGVIGNATVTICYFGDVDDANETWAVTISGEVLDPSEGPFSPAPTSSNPWCRAYTVTNTAFQNDINADGDIDFSFNLDGAGWQYNSPPLEQAGDTFGYYVQSVSFNYVVNVPLVASATNSCPDGTNPTFTSSLPPGTVAGDSGTFSIEPMVPAAAFTTMTAGGDIVATLDVSAVPSDNYMVTYTYSVSGCEYSRTVNFEVEALPNPTLQDVTQTCLSPGSSFSLSAMFDPNTTPGGSFSVDGNPEPDGTFTVPTGGGTFTVTYTIAHDDEPCISQDISGMADLTITTSRDASFTITGPPSPACSDGGVVVISLAGNDAANAANHTFTINGVAPTPSAANAELPAPTLINTFTYNICMTATNGIADDPATTDVDESCATTTCQTYSTRNDGLACGDNAAFSSNCSPELTRLCPIDTKSDFRIECGFFQLNLGQIAEAGLSATVTQLSCTDPSLTLNWTGNNLLDEAASLPINTPGNPSIASLAGLGGFCEFVTDDFCIPIPFSDDLCPLAPIGDLLQCNTSIAGVLSTALTLTTQGSRGGLIMADTDGDGAFDYLAEEYSEGVLGSAPPTSGTITVPNNVVGSGYISVRNVYGYPDNPKGVCGDPAAGGPDLLEILPIGAIPIAGPIIENVLTVAGCSVDLSFTDEATVQIPVYNDQVPSWANCPEDNYYFNTTTTDCTAPANWSVPVAYDACTGLVLPYHGRTNGTTTTYFTGTPSPEVTPGQGGLEEGVYQTGGPVLGSDLPAGVYEIEFTAYSCEARTSTCTFNLVVEEGDLQLICPSDVTVKNDDEVCTAVVSNLEPLSGLSCQSIVNYRIDYPAATGIAPAIVTTPYTTANTGTWNLVSGLVFPQGTSTVTYTMLIDFNGDGDVDDPNEMQTCEFDVTVIDAARPTALCRDIHVTLDNTGSATVFAVDQMDGSPFSNGGSYDNCDTDLSIQLQEVGEVPADFIDLDCDNVGTNVYNLVVTDDAGNQSTCIATVEVHEFFEDIQLELDVPELCLETVNPEQLDFSNYLNITLPDGTVLNHNDVSANAYLGDVEGAFGITAFYADNASASPDAGSITADGIYTPGAGSGFVTISYALALPGVNIPQNGNLAFASCVTIVHTTFELRQPLDMESPECECIVQNDRIVDLGEVSGGLEPYTIQYGGVQLDINSDGIADDVDGEYIYDVANGADISDFVQDLGNLLVDYTQPTWSFTIVDARGCELFRSGSCDNDDETGTPMIDCTALGAVTLYTRDEPACEVQDTWTHTLPTDNCDVILYTYTIENPDGTIEGPFDLTALVNPDITNPLPDQFYGEYDFQHHSPTENVSTVTYYAEDAVGNFTQCSFTVTVIDDDPPRFINCPEPAVIVDAPESWCAAFANYSLPLAVDNCGTVEVSQIDDTGLTSGSLFPVGITINTFEAVDETGNSVTCDVKIIVNDYHTPPTLECPSDVATTNDPGDCGAVVDNIAPFGIEDNCPENLTVIYRIDDEDGNEIANGLDDASGTFFELGTSTVSYAVQDMPLLLITEVTHELSNPIDGVPATTPSCFDGVQNGDESDVDCGGGVCPSCNCTDNEVIVEIVLDGNPTETTWTITEPNDGAVLAAGGPYAAGQAGTTVTESICLPDDCYDFVIRDAGLNGTDTYTVTTGATVLASGGAFGAREVTNFCLDGTPTAAALAGTAGSRDAIEITNFGSANLDVSCLMIERVFAGGSETYAVPTGAILAPGGVLTIHFGSGHDDPANNVYYVAGTSDLAITEPTAYIVSLSRSILDVVVMNDFDISGLLVPPAYDLGGLTAADYWSGSVSPVLGGGIIRTTVWDTDTAEDFVPAEACMPITLGMLNPGLPQPTPNGASTAIQAQPTVRVECTPFDVTVTDDEAAVCGLYSDYNDYAAGPVDIAFGECSETVISVADVYDIADLNLTISGMAGNLGNLDITLISPEGTSIELIEGICPGDNAVNFTLDGDVAFGPPVQLSCGLLDAGGDPFVPVGDIEAFNGEAVQGDWIVQVAHNGRVDMTAASLSYVLSVSARDPYDQGDVTLDNDPDECGAEFTWFHPILFDNCPGGFIQWQIIFEGEEEQVNTLLPIFPENTEVTYFFEVGVSEVRYTLTDAAGNTSTCGFEVEVLDVQFPTLTCPPDLVIQLEGGECTTIDYPTIPVTADDNCPGFTFSSIPPGTPVPIGDTIVTLIVTDASGNATECTYNLSVLEYVPEGPPACIGNQNVTLGTDCEAEITADMMLSGDDYRCYDNYIVTLYEVDEDGQPGLPIATSPFVGLDHVGQEIIAEVCDPATGLCCWGYVLIEFKDAPEFICPPDQTVRCTDSTLPQDMGEPIVTSCVPGGALIEFDDNVIDNGMCGEPRLIIQRTWTVTDGEGNSSTCLQTITMERFDLSEVVFPRDTTVNCAAVLADPSLTSTDSLGVPMINDSIPVAVVSLCSGAVNMTEDRFDICENSYIIFRTWRVINQCDENPLAGAITRTQTIRVEDIDGPDLICPDDQVSSTGPNECRGNYQVPPLVVGDACSAVTYQVAIDGDTLPYRDDHQYLAIGLEMGEHEVRYIATDECGKWSSCAYTLTVADLVEPYASCDDQLNISIGGGDIANGAYGTNRVFATDVNEGSSDNCSEVSLLVRREIVDPQNYDCLDQFDYDSDGIVLNDEVRRDPNDFSNPNGWFTPWLPYADFTCCDVGQSLLVELQVTDQAGNSNVCWQDVVPEDKLRPFCYAPANQTLSCVDLPLTFPGDIEAAYNEDREGTVAMLNALFGEPSGTDNCRLDMIVENRPSMNLNDCGWGTITRRFEVWQLKPEGDVNNNGRIDRDEVLYSVNPCAQLITVTETHDFTIDFPEDAAADCEDPCIPEIEVIMPGCDNVLVNTSEPQRFAASGDECYKLAITYDVINWCIWDGEYEGTVIKRRTEDDGEALPTDRAVESAERPVLHVSGPDEDNLTITLDRRHTRRQTCGSNVSGDDSRLRDDEVSDEDDSLYAYADNEDWRGILAAGRWQYTQFIKVYDETAPEVTVDEFGGPTELCPDLEPGQFGDAFGNCEADVTITFSVNDDCDALDGAVENVVLVSAELDGFAVDANRDGDIKVNEFTADDIPFSLVDNGDNTYTFSGSFPIIESALGDNVYHALRVVFEDGCGNQTSEYIEFDVIDCKGPAPSCLNGVTITIMPQPEGGCAMATWASDFEASPVYDCTGQGPEVNPSNDEQERVTKYAIYRQSTVEDDPNFVPSPEDTGLTLTQDDPEQTFVYVYAFDEEGNYDYCTTYIQVEAHVDCGNSGTGSLAGTIVREDDETVESVEMTVSGGQAASVSTGADGNFLISGLAFGTDLTLTPFRNDDHDNGVTTFDIVLITKQILGTELLDSPYKLIAADANNSGTITTLDIIQIRKLILNIDTEFTNNTSWRFVAEDYSFPSSLNPWSEVFPEVFNVNNFSGSMLDVDFVAIKVGDVNNSATANSLQGGGRTLHDTFHLEMEAQELKAGNTYTVPVYGSELMAGFQGTLQLNGAELVDVVYGLAAAENFGLQYAEQGVVTMSWNSTPDSYRESKAATTPVFSLVVHATQDQPLSEAVAISSRYTTAEAYSQGGAHRNLSLQFNGKAVAGEQFELYQNTPNPVVGATLISFYLPVADKATLTISDAQGRTIMQQSSDYAAGYHTLNLSKTQLQGITGVLSYTLTAGEYTATKQMVIVK